MSQLFVKEKTRPQGWMRRLILSLAVVDVWAWLVAFLWVAPVSDEVSTAIPVSEPREGSLALDHRAKAAAGTAGSDTSPKSSFEASSRVSAAAFDDADDIFWVITEGPGCAHGGSNWPLPPDKELWTQWKKGEIRFPIQSLELLTDDEIAVTLAEFPGHPLTRSEPPCTLGHLLTHVSAAGLSSAVPNLRKMFQVWYEPLGKLYIGRCLARFGDFTGVARAKEMFRNSNDPELRVEALSLLEYACRLEDLERMLAEESDPSMRQSLEGQLYDRQRWETAFQGRYGYLPREATEEHLNTLLQEGGTGYQIMAAAELYNRRRD